MAEEIKSAEIKIEIDEVTAQGVYVNLAMIGHTETEFIIDFIFVQPQVPKAKVRARIITSPQHMKRLLIALEENIRKYESQFGEIRTLSVPEQKIGFYH